MKKKYLNVFFIGIGGIGMSAIARYFIHEGYSVAGYDRTPSLITDRLIEIGADIHFEDNLDLIDSKYKDIDNTIVVYTPAIPASHSELRFFLDNNYTIYKRSKMLGVLSQGKYLMAVAGTHGKTSTSTMLAFFHNCAKGGEGSAILGGVSKNLDSNLLLGSGDVLVTEADEFDRSFLQLYPDVALVTSTDADHLDIYSNHDALKQSFSDFTSQIKNGGSLIYRYGIDLKIENENINTYTYSLDCDSDFKASNIITNSDGTYTFDIICPDCVVENCRLSVIGRINVENCVGAVAMLWVAGMPDHNALRDAIFRFSGVKRRFDIYINTPQLIYMDDYAHHPQELYATISSIKSLYPNRKLTAMFQPHLFTRTRDFCDGFASSLSLCDKAILLPIYPARELPIEGVDSSIIFDKITTEKLLIEKCDLLEFIENEPLDIFITFGAGDIDAYCKPIYETLKTRI